MNCTFVACHENLMNERHSCNKVNFSTIKFYLNFSIFYCYVFSAGVLKGVNISSHYTVFLSIGI